MRRLMLISALFSAAAFGQSAFVESNGLVVIEAESLEPLGAGWVRVPPGTSSAADIDDPGGALGGGYIVWEGAASNNTVNNGRITAFVRITNPGTYRFLWRNQVGLGTNTTEHNDTWLRVGADAFYGFRSSSGSTVCPRGAASQGNACVGAEPNGSSRDGFFKVYSSGAANWKWQASTSDNDAHDLFARFDSAGDYAFELAGRSTFHVIDRIVLFRSDVSQAFATDAARAESAMMPIDSVFRSGFEDEAQASTRLAGSRP